MRAHPGLSRDEIRTYPLVLAWSEIHAYWVAERVKCQWISELDEGQQEGEYYEPLKKMFALVRERRKEREALSSEGSEVT